ncbi:MAG: hypothetical protein ACM4D3_24405 [Candidatus Sericytochromatia bacterium]|jgi:hypothetical protein
MSRQVDLSPTEREAMARQALDDLGKQRDDHALLRVQCGRSHHVAAVFETPAGPVFESLLGPHAHGDRDFVDTAHHGTLHGSRYVDMLEAGRFTEDLIPARCECGTYELSRSELQRAIDAHQRTVLLT